MKLRDLLNESETRNVLDKYSKVVGRLVRDGDQEEFEDGDYVNCGVSWEDLGGSGHPFEFKIDPNGEDLHLTKGKLKGALKSYAFGMADKAIYWYEKEGNTQKHETGADAVGIEFRLAK